MGDFFIARLFDRTIDFLGQSLNIRGARQGLLTSNIANAETPEYAAKDIPFQKILKQKLGDDSGVQLEKTHMRHFPEPGVLPGRESGLPWELEKDPQGVNLDREMTKLAENNLMYQSAVQAKTMVRKKCQVEVIDTGKVAMGLGLIVLAAAREADRPAAPPLPADGESPIPTGLRRCRPATPAPLLKGTLAARGGSRRPGAACPPHGTRKS